MRRVRLDHEYKLLAARAREKGGLPMGVELLVLEDST
jgi:hypothetical protein